MRKVPVLQGINTKQVCGLRDLLVLAGPTCTGPVAELWLNNTNNRTQLYMCKAPRVFLYIQHSLFPSKILDMGPLFSLCRPRVPLIGQLGLPLQTQETEGGKSKASQGQVDAGQFECSITPSEKGIQGWAEQGRAQPGISTSPSCPPKPRAWQHTAVAALP